MSIIFRNLNRSFICLVPDTGFRIPDSGFRIPFWIPDPGSISGFRIPAFPYALTCITSAKVDKFYRIFTFRFSFWALFNTPLI